MQTSAITCSRCPQSHPSHLTHCLYFTFLTQMQKRPSEGLQKGSSVCGLGMGLPPRRHLTPSSVQVSSAQPVSTKLAGYVTTVASEHNSQSTSGANCPSPPRLSRYALPKANLCIAQRVQHTRLNNSQLVYLVSTYYPIRYHDDDGYY